MNIRSLLVGPAGSSRTAESVATGLVVFLLTFFASGSVPVLNGDEARFSQAAREMLENRDPVVPTFAGADRYDKPILVYWATAASYAVFGVSPRTARLPSNLAAAFAAALLAWWARRRAGPGTGFAAGLLLALSPVFFVQARACTADSLNLLLTLAAILAAHDLIADGGDRSKALLFWISLGLALLTKGPVAPFFLGATALGLWAVTRSWRRWEATAVLGLLVLGAAGAGPIVLLVPIAAALVGGVRNGRIIDGLQPFRLSWGLPLLALITLPWTVAAWRATDGAFFEAAVGRHVIERGLTPLEGHAGFPGFYLATALILAFPWIGILLGSASDLRRKRCDDFSLTFLIAWAAGSLLALEVLGTKLVHYWMPAYPAAVLLLVLHLRKENDGEPGIHRGWTLVHLVGGLVLSVVPILVVFRFGLTDLLLPAVATALPLLAGALWSAWMLPRNQRRTLVVAGSAAALYLTALVGWFLPALSNHFIGPKTAAAAISHHRQNENFAIYRLRDEDLLFQLPSGVDVRRSPEAMESLLETADPPLVITRRRDFDRLAPDHPLRRAKTVARIEGIDLGRGRWVESLFLRPIRSTPS